MPQSAFFHSKYSLSAVCAWASGSRIFVPEMLWPFNGLGKALQGVDTRVIQNKTLKARFIVHQEGVNLCFDQCFLCGGLDVAHRNVCFPRSRYSLARSGMLVSHLHPTCKCQALLVKNMPSGLTPQAAARNWKRRCLRSPFNDKNASRQ